MEDILSKQSANVYFAATVQLKPVPTEILTMAIMLIHAFVASKINNHNFCFLNGLELPAVCYLQLTLNKAVPDLSCSQKQEGIPLSLSEALGPNWFPMQQLKMTIVPPSFMPKKW